MPLSGKQAVLVSRGAGGKRVAIVPMHKELQKGTLRGIAKQAGIDRRELGL